MSDNKYHINNYSAADIQRYLKGQLSAAEMHAMEKAALDDPFLADAIEGMEQTLKTHDDRVIATHLQELKQQLLAKVPPSVKTAPVRSMRWWQAAAAAVVLVTGGVFAYNSIFRSNDERTVAQTSEKARFFTLPDGDSIAEHPTNNLRTDTTVVIPAAPPTANATTRQKNNKVPVVQQPQAAGVLANGVAITTDSVTTKVISADFAAAEREAYFIKQRDEAAKKESADRKNVEQAAATEVVKLSESDQLKRKEKGFANNKISDPALRNVIRGRVVDQYNKPLSNALLQTEQNRSNFITDKNGYFNIPATATDSVLQVEVQAIGFASQNFRLQNNANVASNQIQLQPTQFELNNVVVTGKEVKRTKSAGKDQLEYPTILVQDAQPVYGWVGYEQYLEKNKKIPGTTPVLSGDVVVSFQVSKKGELSRFKVVQSLAKAYDDEAIRLVKEGPSWKLLKGRKATATVIIHF